MINETWYKVANRALLTEIRRVHTTHRGRYGAPRIHAALRADGQTASRSRVERLMHHHGIRARTPRRFRVGTTDSHHDLPIAPNRLDQKFAAGRGILFGLTSSEARRAAMLAAVAPNWDGNETWLVVTAVILWGAFPVAYAGLLYQVSESLTPAADSRIGIYLIHHGKQLSRGLPCLLRFRFALTLTRLACAC